MGVSGFAPVPATQSAAPFLGRPSQHAPASFSDRSGRFSLSDLTAASRLGSGVPDARTWRRRQAVKGAVLITIIALAVASLGLTGLYLVSPKHFYAGVDKIRDSDLMHQLFGDKSHSSHAPGVPFNTVEASLALERAAARVASCKTLDGPTGPGRAEVRFFRSGAAQSVQVFPPFAGTEVGRCVEKLFGSIAVSPYGGSEVIVAKTFTIP
jgi:hypothetical protein